MYSLLLLSLSAAFIAYLVTPAVARTFFCLGIRDEPDDVRKLHDRAVPRVGGIPIVIAYLGAFGILSFASLSANAIVNRGNDLLLALLPSIAIIFAVGLLDDVFRLNPWYKLLAQAAASSLAVLAGIKIHLILGMPLNEPVSIVATIVWLIGCSNAFNLIDGIDGLATGIGLFAAVTMLVGALLQDNMALALAMAPLAGALAGFLRYNFSPASIFLGDSGSLLIGFLLGTFAVIWEQKSTAALGLTAPLMVLSIPLLDTSIAIIRRFVRRQPIFAPDRGHIHHRLLARGLSHRKIAVVLYLASAACATFSLIQVTVDRTYAGIVIILFCGLIGYGTYRLGFIELVALGRLVSGSTIWDFLKIEVLLFEVEEMIRAAETLEALQTVVSESCSRLGFDSAQVLTQAQFRQENYMEQMVPLALKSEGPKQELSLADPDTKNICILKIPISEKNCLVLTKNAPVQELSPGAVAFVENLSRVLARRMVQLTTGLDGI